MDKIATEQEAYEIGKTGQPNPTRLASYMKAKEMGCIINGKETPPENKLIPLSQLKAANHEVIMTLEGEPYWGQQYIKLVFAHPENLNKDQSFFYKFTATGINDRGYSVPITLMFSAGVPIDDWTHPQEDTYHLHMREPIKQFADSIQPPALSPAEDETGRPFEIINKSVAEIKCNILYSLDGRYLVLNPGSIDGTTLEVRTFGGESETVTIEPGAGDVKLSISGELESVTAVSPDDKNIYIVDNTMKTRCVYLATDKNLSGFYSIGFSKDGKTLFATNGSGITTLPDKNSPIASNSYYFVPSGVQNVYIGRGGVSTLSKEKVYTSIGSTYRFSQQITSTSDKNINNYTNVGRTLDITFIFSADA